MLELTTLGPMTSIALLLLIAGVASYGITLIIKRFMASYKDAHKNDPDRPGDRPWWWNSLLRTIAVAIGTGAGYVLMNTIVGAGLGLVAGVLNTTIYFVAKDKVKDIIKGNIKRKGDAGHKK